MPPPQPLGAPESALVVGRARRVGTIVGVWVDARIALDVHVESLAIIGLVTQRCTSERVEALQGIETHVLGGTE